MSIGSNRSDTLRLERDGLPAKASRPLTAGGGTLAKRNASKIGIKHKVHAVAFMAKQAKAAERKRAYAQSKKK
jgi:hypothetical protein